MAQRDEINTKALAADEKLREDAIAHLPPLTLDGKQQYFETVVKRYLLDDRERLIVASHLGVYGERITMREIGERLGANNPKDALTRQRVHAIIRDLRAEMGETVWMQLEAYFPEPMSDSQYQKIMSRQRRVVREYLRLLGPNDHIQYEDVHHKLGLKFRPVDRPNAAQMGELESCSAFMEDYGAKNFGKYRYCTMCKTIKPSSDFYTMESGYVYQLCKPCNTRRCINFARTGDGSLMPVEETA